MYKFELRIDYNRLLRYEICCCIRMHFSFFMFQTFKAYNNDNILASPHHTVALDVLSFAVAHPLPGFISEFFPRGGGGGQMGMALT